MAEHWLDNEVNESHARRIIGDLIGSLIKPN